MLGHSAGGSGGGGLAMAALGALGGGFAGNKLENVVGGK
jgi:uncharacterized protein YcfJ